LKLQHDEPLSNFGFNFNLCCYIKDILVKHCAKTTKKKKKGAKKKK